MSPMRFARCRRGAAAGISVFVLLWGSASPAQNVTEPSLKAAYVYSFAKFTEWPTGVLPNLAPFVACVSGNTSVSDALERIVKGRLLSGHRITVSSVTLDGPLRSCHVLYISGVTAAQATQILTVVRGAPVLTIVDVEGFARRGGIAHLFVESGTLRFDVDHGLAKRSQLQLSSKLLQLATHVHDQPDTAVP